jgi:hypothetical protein
MVNGNMGSGQIAFRTSLPGYDVLAEPLGSANISFDSRLGDIGTVVASGLVICGGATISFPTMGYVPIFRIALWDGNIQNQRIVNVSGSGHLWLPSIGIITSSSLQVVAYTNPFFNTLAYNNPTGSYYLYYIFASG